MRCLRALIPLLLLLLSLVACHPDDPVATRRFEQATRLLPIEPEESLLLLDSIEYPENLNARQNARWCMLKGQVADTIHSPMPYSSQLERAVRYFKREGSPLEQAQALFYLGRAYADEKIYNGAQEMYQEALALALSEKNWNLAGYIVSYMGDVYEFKATYDLAEEKYLEATEYFRKAGNKRSQAFAFSNAGRQAAFEDSLDMALDYMKKADSLIQGVGDSSDIASVLNGLGNVYRMRGEYEKAKAYLNKSIIWETNDDDVPTYSALASLYIELGNLDSARYYCRLAEAPTMNPHTHIRLYYKYYLIAKQEENTNLALSYLERYFEKSDSITLARNDADIISVEKRYKHNHLISENRILRKSNYRYISLSIFILLIASVFVIIYQIRVNRRNRIIIKPMIGINTNAELKQISTQLEQYKNSRSSEENQALLEQYAERQKEAEQLTVQIQKQRQDLFQESAIMKKLLKLSEKVIAGNQKSLLSDKDWKAIYAQVASSYPTAAKFLRESNLTEKEQQLAYLSVFNFEAKREAILLGAQLDAVNKQRQRLRRKLGITDRNLSLHDYLVSME